MGRERALLRVCGLCGGASGLHPQPGPGWILGHTRLVRSLDPTVSPLSPICPQLGPGTLCPRATLALAQCTVTLSL